MPWIEVNGGGTRYDLRGDGSRTVVLIHEMGGTVESWEPLLPHLSPDLRVLRYDMRGFGQASKVRGVSDKDMLLDDLFALLDALSIGDPVDLCGMAVGGAICFFAGAREPGRVRSLGLLGPALGVAPERRQAVSERADSIEADGMASIASSELELTYPIALRMDESYPEYRARWLGNDPSSYAATYRMLVGFEAGPVYAGLRPPSLLLAGELDPLRPPSLISEAAKNIPGARFETVPGGHVMAHQTPRPVAEKLNAFWSTT